MSLGMTIWNRNIEKKQNDVIWIQIGLLQTKKTDDIYKDNAEDIGTRSDPSNYELNKPITREKKRRLLV